MQSFDIQTQSRSALGKSSARALRREGWVPAVLYGAKDKNFPIAVSPQDVERLLKTEWRRNVIFKLNIESQEKLAMVKDLQQDPVSGQIQHVDFYQIKSGEPVEVHVPLITTGRAVGVVNGGKLGLMYRLLPIRALPDKVPAKIEVDVTHLDLHDHIRVNELSVPDGVEILLPEKTTIISVQTIRVQKEEEAAVQPGQAVPTEPGAVPAAPGAEAPPAATPAAKS